MVSLIHSGREGSCHSGAVMASLLHHWGETLLLDTRTQGPARDATEKMEPEKPEEAAPVRVTVADPPPEMAPNTPVEPSSVGETKAPPVCQMEVSPSCKTGVSPQSASLPDQLLQLARDTLTRLGSFPPPPSPPKKMQLQFWVHFYGGGMDQQCGNWRKLDLRLDRYIGSGTLRHYRQRLHRPLRTKHT